VKHEVMMLNDEEMETDSELVQILEILRQWALYRGFDPDKSLTIRFKSRIFPVEAK